MGFSPEQMPPQILVEPKEVLTWAQIAYYSAGALVAICVAYLKFRAIRRRKQHGEEETSSDNR
jgi:hypothetical protein